jgi:imidazolonepropionase-like amidohydrolase
MAGFTTIRVAGSRDFLDVDLRDAINEGAIVGPRILASGCGLTTTGGHYHNWCAVEVDGVDAVRREVRQHIKRGVDSIKLMLSPGIATEGADVSTEQFTLEEVQAAVYEAHKVGRSVLSHAIGIGGIRNGVEAGVDSIDHGHYLDEEQARKMKAKGIYLVPTFGPTHYYVHKRQAEPWRIARAEQVEPIHAAAFRLALEIGVPIALGCDCGAQSRMPNGENALEIELMVENGMSPMAAILAATREAARLTRILPNVGTLTPGKAADRRRGQPAGRHQPAAHKRPNGGSGRPGPAGRSGVGGRLTRRCRSVRRESDERASRWRRRQARADGRGRAIQGVPAARPGRRADGVPYHPG